MTYYAVTRSPYLQHHGILGQKWGVRRYQDKNGRLTSAGKKRYSTSGRGAEAAIKSDATLSKVFKDYWRPEWKTAVVKGSKDHENAMAAADLGLKALDKLGRNPEGKLKLSGVHREWFLFEDQTIGLPTAAHLINKGHSASDVKKFFKAVSDNIDHDTEYSKFFDIDESGYRQNPKGVDEFIDACASIKKEETYDRR